MTPALRSYLESDPEVVPLVRLIDADFKSGRVRLCESDAPLQAGGHTWEPHYGLIEAKPLQITGNPFDANPARYTAWNISTEEGQTLAYKALNNPDEYVGRKIIQAFAVRGFDDVIVVHAGYMRKITPTESASRSKIEIQAESIASKRGYTPLGEYTPRDQARLYPNVTDRAFRYVATMPGKVIKGWLVG